VYHTIWNHFPADYNLKHLSVATFGATRYSEVTFYARQLYFCSLHLTYAWAFSLFLMLPSPGAGVKYALNHTSCPHSVSCFGGKWSIRTEPLLQYICCVYEQLHCIGIFRSTPVLYMFICIICCTGLLTQSCFSSLCDWHCISFEGSYPLQVDPYHSHS